MMLGISYARSSTGFGPTLRRPTRKKPLGRSSLENSLAVRQVFSSSYHRYGKGGSGRQIEVAVHRGSARDYGSERTALLLRWRIVWQTPEHFVGGVDFVFDARDDFESPCTTVDHESRGQWFSPLRGRILRRISLLGAASAGDIRNGRSSA